MSRLLNDKCWMLVVTIALTCSLLFSANVNAATFSPYQIYPVAPWPTGWPDAVAVGDFNGDGRKDVVLATTSTSQGPNPDDHTLFIFLQTASGGLAAPMKVKYSSDAEEGNDTIGYKRLTAMVAADFNGDGIDDIIAGRRFGISVVLGRRDTQFSVKRVECTSGACGPDSMAVMDVDRDGKLDLLAHNEWGTSFGITVYFGAGGDFTHQRFLTTRSDGGVNVRVGDMNSDGQDDVAISWMQGLSNGAEVFLGDGSGWFLPGQLVPRHPQLINTRALAVGDFDGDSLDDIAMGGATYDFNGQGFYLHSQANDGTFRSPTQLPAALPSDSANVPDKAVVADINGDGRDDLVLLRSGGSIGYFEQGSGGLKPEVIYNGPYATWGDAHAIATGDVNNDGCIDVVTANYNHGLVVFRSSDCQIRIRVNGSQPLIRGNQTQPVRPAVRLTGRSPYSPIGQVAASRQLSNESASQQNPVGESSRSALWLRLMLGISLLCFVFWKFW